MLRRASQLIRRFLDLSLADRIYLLRAAAEVWHVRRRLTAKGVRDFRQLGTLPAGLACEHESSARDEMPFAVAVTPASASGSIAVDESAIVAARRTARLVQAARHLLPGRCTCLELALAGQRLLAAQQIPAEVRIGVRKNGDEFEAHAWLESLGAVVMGGDDVYQRYAAMPPLGLGTWGVRQV